MTTLQELRDTFKKWLYLESTDGIDLRLAIAISSIAHAKGKTDKPIWMLFAGASGDKKSALLHSLDDGGKHTHLLYKFTSKTLVSGLRRKDQKTGKTIKCDLAPKLRGKLLLFSDLAEILKLHPYEKAAIFSQLRELYDGKCGSSTGAGTDERYEDLRISLMANAMPQTLDTQILIHHDLGTRELVYREIDANDEETMDRIIANDSREHIMERELKKVMKQYLTTHKYKRIKKIPTIITDKLKALTQQLRHFRATAVTDSFNAELRCKVVPEKPTRLLKQFLIIYQALKSLDKKYSDELALQIINDIAKSSAFENRMKVMREMANDPYGTHTISGIANAESVKLGKKSVAQELNLLWSMDLVNKVPGEITTTGGKVIEVSTWQLNYENPTTKTYLKSVDPAIVPTYERMK